MVDWYGNWTFEPNTPEDKKNDSDRVAEWILSKGYTPKTSIENLVDMIWAYYDSPDNDHPEEFDINSIAEFVEISGGLSEFDYYC